jgi:type I restriction enzyme S subunit
LVPLQEGPAKFFRLSPDEREALGGFAVRRGEVRERLDAVYAADMQLLADRYATPLFPLAEIGSFATKVQYGTSARSISAQIGTPVLRIPNLQLDGWALGDLKYLELSERELDNYRLQPGDILFNRTNGSRELVGKCEVFDFEGDWAFASYLIRLRLDQKKANPYFVSAFLNTKWGRRQVEHASRQILMSNINAEEIRALRIPLPHPDIQTALLAELDAARAARDAGLAAADLALDGLDAFILDALGVRLPPPRDDAPFAVNRASLRNGGKIFPNYYNPDRRHAIVELKRVGADVLENVAQFVREQRAITADDQTYVGLANVRSNTGEYIDADEDVGGMVSAFAKGDVLFAKLRPYLNKVWVADRAGVCSPEFHVLRLIAGGPVDSPEYLAAVLRSSPTLAQTKRMMTGNTHPRLAPEDVVELVVPTPSRETQRIIATEVDKRRAEARRLRAAAREGWATARQAFEEALLGPAT